MRNFKGTLSVLGCTLVLVVAPTAAAPTLTFNFTTVNVPGAASTFPTGINNAGVIVGRYNEKSGAFNGFMLTGKKVTAIGDPKGTNTSCLGINLGTGTITIVGFYLNSSGTMGFLYTPGNKQFTDVTGPAGALASFAEDINDKGEIVGDYIDSGGTTHGFFLAGEKYYSLDVPGASATYALAINDEGNILLDWFDSKGNWEASLLPNYKSKKYKMINARRNRFQRREDQQCGRHRLLMARFRR